MDSGGGGSGGTAPFLQKTYDMVDDPATADIVSWSEAGTSFVVWNPPEFAARLLPTFFKHNNFSSFIRQLNTYGFRKIDPERWEFANEHFANGQRHLLKNIHRRRPIHSHSHSQSGGSLPDSERAVLEGEIDRLTQEKIALRAELSRFEEQQAAAEIQIEDLEHRMHDMEQRHMKMMYFMQQATKNELFMQNLVRMAGSSLDFNDALHKKRRLPGLDGEVSDGFQDDHVCTSSTHADTAAGDTSNLFNQDFCDKLRLELCPAMTESNLVSNVSTQESSEDHISPKGTNFECDSMGMPSSCLQKNRFLSEEDNDVFPCQLNLSLASSTTMEIDSSYGISIVHNENFQLNGMSKSKLPITTSRADAPSLIDHEVPAPPPARPNDVFWAQFLTERPGTDNANSSVEQPMAGDGQEGGRSRSS